jgi:MFS family permease
MKPAMPPWTALAALVACQIGLHACMQGARLAAPLSVLRQGHSAWSVGLVMTMFALFPALLAIPAGRLADRHGYHLPARIAALMSMTGMLLAAAGDHLAALCAAAALCGAGSGFGMIAVQRTAGRLARDAAERLRIFSWVALAPAVAGLFGPMLAGVLIDHAGFRAAFLALALLPAATLLLSRAVPRDGVGAPCRRDATPPSAWALLREPAVRRLLFINWLVSASWDVHGFALPILGVERGLSAAALGTVLAAYAAAAMAVRLLIPLVAERLPQRHLLSAALLLTGLVFVLYPLLHSAWAMALCAAAFGIALGAVQPAILTTLHEVTPPERHGEALALRSMTVHLSMVAMPLLFGLIGASMGATALFWMMAAALGSGGAAVRQLGPVQRRV